jgi:hypothetical protein
MTDTPLTDDDVKAFQDHYHAQGGGSGGGVLSGALHGAADLAKGAAQIADFPSWAAAGRSPIQENLPDAFTRYQKEKSPTGSSEWLAREGVDIGAPAALPGGWAARGAEEAVGGSAALAKALEGMLGEDRYTRLGSKVLDFVHSWRPQITGVEKGLEGAAVQPTKSEADKARATGAGGLAGGVVSTVPRVLSRLGPGGAMGLGGLAVASEMMGDREHYVPYWLMHHWPSALGGLAAMVRPGSAGAAAAQGTDEFDENQ